MQLAIMGHSARIIPARAGFTQAQLTHLPQEEDHPRSRGVYGTRKIRGLLVYGSSPLARGLRGAQPLAERQIGIIPARAGFTGRWTT